jgi:hypothetical protein
MTSKPSNPILEQMLRDSGQTHEDFRRQAAKGLSYGKSGTFKPSQAVQRTPELDRIVALPRRRWEDRGEVLADKITEFYRVPRGQMKLRPIQAAALAEIHDMRGALLPIRVGGGKTLISLLTFVVLNARRPVLLLPAKLIEKTQREMEELRKHWLLPGKVHMMSYELLGRPQSAQALEDVKPDVLVGDECHKLKNTSAAVTRRVKRYVQAHPETVCVWMSGTIIKRSLNDFVHLAEWALRRMNPTPIAFQDRLAWGMALDETKDEEGRLAPGELIRLCNDEERARYADDPLSTVRIAFRRRMTETPGVVASQDGQLGVSLRIDSVSPDVKGIDEALASLRHEWERPDGEPIIDAIELWRHLRELSGTGFYYRWNPTPPQDWIRPRRAWAKMCREILKHNRSGLDSESQVVHAVDQGYYPVARQALHEWRAVRDTFVPQTEAVWLSQDVLNFCADWMRKENGIVWVEHVEFGRTLSMITGVPFYQRQGQDQHGRVIEMHPPGTAMIASVASNHEGRNLQGWSKNLITSPPSSGAIWEQLLGRTHRDGQKADEVTATILVVIAEQAAAFERACRDAKAQTQLTGQEQKLSYADITVTPSEQVRR